MSFKKQDIYKALETITAPGEGKSLVENENITNIVTFGKEVIVDVTISNPSLQAKKRVESEIINTLRLKVSQDIVVKVNVKAVVPKKENPNEPTANIEDNTTESGDDAVFDVGRIATLIVNPSAITRTVVVTIGCVVGDGAVEDVDLAADKG